MVDDSGTCCCRLRTLRTLLAACGCAAASRKRMVHSAMTFFAAAPPPGPGTRCRGLAIVRETVSMSCIHQSRRQIASLQDAGSPAQRQAQRIGAEGRLVGGHLRIGRKVLFGAQPGREFPLVAARYSLTGKAQPLSAVSEVLLLSRYRRRAPIRFRCVATKDRLPNMIVNARAL